MQKAIYATVGIDELLSHVQALKGVGARFVQMHAERNIDDGTYRLVYTFIDVRAAQEQIARDGNYAIENLVVEGIDQYQEIPSISSYYPAVFPFENEAHDLFGLAITDMQIDFKGFFYQVSTAEPMSVITPEVKAAREKAMKVRAAAEDKARKAAAEKVATAMAAQGCRDGGKARRHGSRESGQGPRGACRQGRPRQAEKGGVRSMAHRSVIPFGPQHPVLPEPLHLDLVIEDDRVIEAIPQIGFVHRGLEKLTEKRDMHQFGYIAERICGICAVGHSCGYASACERMLGIEVPGRVQYIRTILHELSRIHSHLLWLGLLADAFGFEALFYRSWTLREQILKIFESTCGGRVILSINEIGGLKHDIEDSELAGIVQTLDAMRPDYEALVHTFLDDDSCGERLHGVGVISKKDALELSMVGPFGRASGVDYDVRMFGDGAYADLAAFEPIVATDGDCYARCQVRCAEVTQAMDIIKELVGKIPHDGIGGRTKLTPADGARGEVVIEQPRGEAYYYVRGNGTKNLDRFRVRTPTSQNLAGLTHALQGVLLANVPMIILTIDPCISCTER